MEIKIPLPGEPTTNTYEELMTYLKQLELAIHYAQKSVKNAQDNGMSITEDCIIKFEYDGMTEDEQNSRFYFTLQHPKIAIYLQ